MIYRHSVRDLATLLDRCSLLIFVTVLVTVPSLFGQTCTYTATPKYKACSNGSDGAYAPTTSGYFVPGNFHGTGVASNVFNFTTITIPAGVNITFDGYHDNAPVYWFASGNVDIEGVLNLNGGALGVTTCLNEPDTRVPTFPGSGGYQGGVGSGPSPGQNAQAGRGPGGGAAGTSGVNAGDGSFTGNIYLTPLVGGSGGGGAYCGAGSYGCSGGGGGGAILIVSAGQITIGGSNPNAVISASGEPPSGNAACTGTGGGSGGAIRLVANAITGSGALSVFGDGGGATPNWGFIRLEANTLTYTGNIYPGPAVSAKSAPYTVLYPTTPIPSVQVTSINGMPITENPFSFPDLTINTNNPLPVVITGHNVPLGTVPMVTILGDTADQRNKPCTGGLTGTLATSTCTMNITFAPGGSRGVTVTTWVP